MTAAQMIEAVEAYFAGVDGENQENILALLTADCVFSVETHGVILRGHSDISGMFERLWSGHAAVRHHGFVHVADQVAGRIASRFQVENTEHDGSMTRKSNCNFFEMEGEKFSKIAVYMAGANTLEKR